MNHDPQHEVGWQGIWRGGHVLRFGVFCLGIWLHAANGMYVTTIMPIVIEDIGSAHLLSWAFTLYLLGSILAGVATGRLVLLFGLRPMMFVAAGVYGGGCVLSTLAPKMEILLAGRLFQGVGGGLMIALAYIGFSTLFPRAIWVRLLSLSSAFWSISAFCGPLIGGLFAQYGSWRGGFATFAVISVVFAIVIPMTLPRTERPERRGKLNLPFARLGVLAVSVLMIATAGVEVGLIRSSVLCGGGVVIFVVFLWLDSLSPTTRMLPTRAFSLRERAGAGMLMVLLISLSTMSFMVYGPLLLRILYGVDALSAGYIAASESIAWGVVAVLFAGVRESAHPALIRIGCAITVVGIVGFALSMPDSSVLLIMPWALAQGAGFGMMWAVAVRRIVEASDAGERECASSAVPTIQHLGFAIGAAMCGIVGNAAGLGETMSEANARIAAFWVFAAFLPLAGLGYVAAWQLSRRDQQGLNHDQR